MTKKTQVYLAFVDVPSGQESGFIRYYLEKHTPSAISGSELMAKEYTRKKDAEKAAKWLRENIRPNWSNGLDFTAKGKRCGVLFKEIVETREETFC